jgi:hypothetical protein
MDIARKITSLPDIACFPFEAEKRLIGRTSSLFGVESNPGVLLLAMYRQGLGIEIADHGGGGIRFSQNWANEWVESYYFEFSSSTGTITGQQDPLE